MKSLVVAFNILSIFGMFQSFLLQKVLSVVKRGACSIFMQQTMHKLEIFREKVQKCETIDTSIVMYSFRMACELGFLRLTNNEF